EAEPMLTAADFPLAQLTQAQFAALLVSLPNLEDLYPATPLQQGLIFHSLLQEGRGVYTSQLRLTLTDRVDRIALRAAWEAAVSRHAVLRTRFEWRHGGAVLQVVQKAVSLPYTEHDWTGVADYEARLAAWQAADVAQGFDLAHAPLLRIHLF